MSMGQMRRRSRLSIKQEGECLEYGDVVRDREMRIKSNTNIANRGIRGKSRQKSVSGKVY